MSSHFLIAQWIHNRKFGGKIIPQRSSLLLPTKMKICSSSPPLINEFFVCFIEWRRQQRKRRQRRQYHCSSRIDRQLNEIGSFRSVIYFQMINCRVSLLSKEFFSASEALTLLYSQASIKRIFYCKIPLWNFLDNMPYLVIFQIHEGVSNAKLWSC